MSRRRCSLSSFSECWLAWKAVPWRSTGRNCAIRDCTCTWLARVFTRRRSLSIFAFCARSSECSMSACWICALTRILRTWLILPLRNRKPSDLGSETFCNLKNIKKLSNSCDEVCVFREYFCGLPQGGVAFRIQMHFTVKSNGIFYSAIVWSNKIIEPTANFRMPLWKGHYTYAKFTDVESRMSTPSA